MPSVRLGQAWLRTPAPAAPSGARVRLGYAALTAPANPVAVRLGYAAVTALPPQPAVRLGYAALKASSAPAVLYVRRGGQWVPARLYKRISGQWVLIAS